MEALTHAEAPIGRALPSYLTTFVGRQRELAALDRLVLDHRLVTLHGPGGIGKSRLAGELAQQRQAEYPQGIVLLELEALNDAEDVPGALLAALDIRPDSARTLIQQAIDYLRRCQALLILDNCEHVLTGCAMLTEALSRRCPGLCILTTSRQVLDIPGEVIFEVPPLDTPVAFDAVLRESEPAILCERALGLDSVRLFIERASRARTGFELTPGIAADVVAACRSLDGLPLAIELAAPRMKALTARQLADSLEHSFELLTASAAHEAHRTLDGLVAWSYDRLIANERVLLARLSVLAGTWTLEAAAAITAGGELLEGEVPRLLSSLVDKSLVARDPTAAGGRYRLPEAVRRYAAQRLVEQGEQELIARRQVQWMRSLASESRRGWLFDLPGWLSRFRQEDATLRTVLHFALHDAPSWEAGLEIAAYSTWYWYMTGALATSWQWLTRFLRLSPGGEPLEPLPPSAVVAEALAFAGSQLMLMQPAAAVGLCEQAATMAETVEADDAVEAHVLHMLGMTAHFAGDSERGRDCLERSLALIGERDDCPWTVHDSLYALGLVAQHQGDDERAMVELQASVALSLHDGADWYLASSLRRLADIHLRHGALADAEAALREALSTSRRLGEKAGLAYELEAFARLAIGRRAWRQALRLAGAADALRRHVGRIEREAALLEDWLEPARLALGQAEAAVARLRGQTMDLEQALDEALGLSGAQLAAPAGTTRERREPQPLTAREREVARLVSQGKTNSQIANLLVITEGTTKRHIENILAKLDLTSRRQIASRLAETSSATQLEQQS